MLRVKTAKLIEVRVEQADDAVVLAFAAEATELHPGHFLEGNSGGFTITIYGTDRAVLVEDATPADIAAAAQGHVKGSRRR